MSAFYKSFLSSEDQKTVSKFVGVLQKCGNRQRALSTLCSLLSLLKAGTAGYPINVNYPLHTLANKNPIKIIIKCLYNLKPAFLLRRVVKSGKRYDLPVPISPNRASFMAIDWLRKTALKNNKNDLSFTFLLAREVSAAVYHQGSAKELLKAYIDIAVDQQPFDKFIRKRPFSVSKSRRTRINTRLAQVPLIRRRFLRVRRHRNTGMIRRINMHNIRSTNASHLVPVRKTYGLTRNKHLNKKLRVNKNFQAKTSIHKQKKIKYKR